MAPGFAVYALIMLYPAVRAVLISLRDYNIVPGASSPFVGLDNYSGRCTTRCCAARSSTPRSMPPSRCPPQVVIGLFLAVLLDARLPGRTLFRVLFYVPVVTSWVVVSLLFQYLFSTDRGFVNWVLVDVLHVVGHNVNWLGDRWPAMIAISLLGIWKGVGWSMLIFLAALTGVPRELHEAAAIDGAGAARPLPSRLAAADQRRDRSVVLVLLVIGGFNVFTSVLLMTGDGPLQQNQVPLTYMYEKAFSFLDFGYGSAISFLLTTVVLASPGCSTSVTQRRVRGTFR